MATTLNFKPILDKPEWRPVAVPQGGLTASNSTSAPLLNSGHLISDFRSNNYNTPKLWMWGSSGVNNMLEYNSVTDAWTGLFNNNWGATGSAGSGSIAAFAPSQGPKGAVVAGSTSSVVNLDTTYYAPIAATWTRSGTAITVTTSRPHNFYLNQRVFVSVSSDTAAIPLSTLTASYTINNIINSTQYQFTGLNAGALSGTLSIGIPILTDQWADRGDGIGFMIRIIGLTSGKIEERRIVANTGYNGRSSSTYVSAPTVYLDQPLSFTPQAGDLFELLSGTIYGTSSSSATSGQWRSFDIAALRNADNIYAQSGSRNVTNLIMNSTGQAGMVVFDEQHVPSNNIPGEGFIVGTATYDNATLSGTNYTNVKRCLQATAIAAGSITGQASGGDSAVATNEYRNFQIRIVEDTVNTTAVGQRRRISSHTAGPSAVYTLSANWTVTPSSSAKFVIENWTDNMLLTPALSTSMMTYKTSNLCEDTAQTINTWSLSQFTSTGGPTHAGVLVHNFGMRKTTPDARHSIIYSISGGNLWTFDIAGGTNGSWQGTNNQRPLSGYFANSSSTITMSYAYDPFTHEGDAIYYFTNSISGVQANHQIFKISLSKGTVEGYTPIKSPYGYLSSGSTAWTSSNPSANNKMGTICFQDGITKITAIYAPAFGRASGSFGSEFFELLITV